jgi:hypothetical protein
MRGFLLDREVRMVRGKDEEVDATAGAIGWMPKIEGNLTNKGCREK